MQFHFFFQRLVGFDKAGNGRWIVGFPELGEEIAHAMYGSFHDELLACATHDDGVANW